MSASQQFVRSLNLDLTRTAEISFNQLTINPIPPITSEMIADFEITDVDIANNADISGSKIAAASIPISKMADVGGQSFADYLTSLSVPGSGVITSEMILDGTILNDDISDGTIEGSKIAIGTITSDNIQDETITNSDISETAAIRWSKINAALSIANGDISDNTIEGSKIASGTITSANIQDGTILNDDISDGTIEGSKIASGTITSANIQDGTILNDDISDGTIEGSKIASGTITSANIQNGTISNVDISDNADISGSKIQAASESTSGVVSTTQQSFAGEKKFKNGIVSSQDYSRDDTLGTTLTNPLPILYSTLNADSSNPFGYVDVLVQNTSNTATYLTNFIVIQIPIDLALSSEVSSYYEVTLLGKQPITLISGGGGSVQAFDPVTSTTRLLITVTGVEVTTTFLGKVAHGTGPHVATKLLQTPGGSFTTNLLIGVGFRQFTAYHIKGVRSGASPNIYFQVSGDILLTQNEVDDYMENNVSFV
jgi:hypothetical protein